MAADSSVSDSLVAADSSVSDSLVAADSLVADLCSVALVSDSSVFDSHWMKPAADSSVSDSLVAADLDIAVEPAVDSSVSAEWKPAQESACFAELLAVHCSESLVAAALERPVSAASSGLLALASSASERFAVGSLHYSQLAETRLRLFAFPLPDCLVIAVEQAEEASDNAMIEMKPTECFHLQSPIQECLDSMEPKCGESPGHTREDSVQLESAGYLAR